MATRQTLRFLDPEVLSRISSLELLARTVVEGFVSGLHRSPYKGFSVEFMEYRPYVPGDDPRRIDWKLWARTDKLFLKEYEDETNTSCHILLDISRSMGYATGKLSKYEYASYLAASLAYLMIRQRDSVGLYLFDHRIMRELPPKSTNAHLHAILTTLEKMELGEESAVGKPFHELAEAVKRRGIIVIISDLLDDPEAIIGGLKHFKFEGNDIVLFHVLDPFETAFDFNDIVELEDMETGEKIMIAGDAARETYLRNLESFCKTMRTQCGLLGIDYDRYTTDTPLDFALFSYLAERAARV